MNLSFWKKFSIVIMSFAFIFFILFVLTEEVKDMNKFTNSDKTNERIIGGQDEFFNEIEKDLSNKNLKPIIRVIKNKKEIYNYAIKNNIPNPDTILDIKIVDFIEENKVNDDYFYSLQPEIVDPDDIYIKRTGLTTFTDYTDIMRESIFDGPGSYTTQVSDTIKCKVSCSYQVNLKILSESLGFDVKQSRTLSYIYSTTTLKEQRIKVTAYPRYQNYLFEVWEKDLFKDDFLAKGNVKRFCGIEFVRRVVSK